ncbi:UNVERIFIED_ORG: hypothetical protein J2Y81_004363 [Paraburkholderia sediminicola]|nr:hypothetical protein [Paraburkholderia sediminicola]
MRFIKTAVLSVEYFRIAWLRGASSNTATTPWILAQHGRWVDPVSTPMFESTA